MKGQAELTSKMIQYGSFFVAGYQYYDGDIAERRLQEGRLLQLQRDAHNPHDHRAVEVWTDTDLKLGYIPADQNEMTAFFLDNSVEVAAIVRELRRDHETWTRLRVDLYVTDRIRSN